jgi:hypothetical protein
LTGEILAIEGLKIVTEENSLERHLLLAKATTHGKKFSATGCLHLTSDDVLIGSEYAIREKEKERLTKEKVNRLWQLNVERKAKEILEKQASNINNNLTVGELNALLALHKVPKLNNMNKERKLQKWQEICSNGP